MEFALNRPRLAAATAATLATAGLFYVGNGLEPWWPLMWFAPVPVMVLALRVRWWMAALASFLALVLSGLNMWRYLVSGFHLPIPAWFAIYSIVGVTFSLGILLFRLLVLRGFVWTGLLAVPSVFVTLEFLRNVVTPHGSAGSLAYSQLKFLPFVQLASVTGPWGMTFVLLWFASALAAGLHFMRTSSRRAFQIIGTAVALTAVVLVFGAIRLATPAAPTVRVGLIASDQPAYANVTGPGPDTERLFRDYVRTARKLTAAGAQAIVMPEKLGVTLAGKSTGTDDELQSLADTTGATVVAGVVEVDAPVKYNEARIYVPSSAIQHYDKEHMLPPFESNLKPGTALTVLEHTSAKWGVAICKDMDFASPARRYGEVGAALLLVPAWDFNIDRSWHGHIAIMRGVEDGFSIARAAKNGFLTVSDNRGRIIGEVSSSSAPFATLLVDVPAAHSWTVYQHLGDWFAWLSIALLVFVVAQAIRAFEGGNGLGRLHPAGSELNRTFV